MTDSLSLVSEGDCIHLSHDISCVLVLNVRGKQRNTASSQSTVQSHPSTACHPLRFANHSHHQDVDLKSNMLGKQDTNIAHEMSCMPINIYICVALYGIWASQFSCKNN